MYKFWKRLKSIKLAIALIVVITIGSLLATFVPQDEARETYFQIYPKLIAELLTQTGLSRYFSSILFLIPILLFFVNLGACTIDRFLREIRRTSRRRHGPDILHFGLLILMIGSVISFSGRTEGSVSLVEGESVQLPSGELLKLRSFTDERYEGGRPKAWISVVDLEKNGIPLRSAVEIQVNKPLHVGDMTIYQSSYSSDLRLTLTGPDGKARILERGDSFQDGSLSMLFMTSKPPAQGNGETFAIIRVKNTGEDRLVEVGAEGIQIGEYRAAANLMLSTGLKAVKDPGYLFVLVALILVGVGTALTFFQKLKELES